MPKATLAISIEGGADVRRALGIIVQETRKATDTMRRQERQAAQEYRISLQQQTRQATQLAQARIRQETAVQQTRMRLEAQASRVTATESRKRLSEEEKTRRGQERAIVATSRVHELEERRRTRLAEREAKEQTRIYAREARQRERDEAKAARNAARAARDARRSAGGAFGGALNAGASYMGAVAGTVQSARERGAGMETSLNSILFQVTRNPAEIARMRNRVLGYATEHHMRPEDVISAINRPQSRFNALGGATAADRMAGLEQTLSDVTLANTVDPSNLEGIPLFSAMLRRQGVGDSMRSSMMRAVTGISFSGSVETEQAIQQGLPALLGSLNRSMAGKSQSQQEEIVRQATLDFMAEVQTSASSGGAVGVSGNRMNVLRDALGSRDTQNRLGTALRTRLDRQSRRQMTPEQRANFDAQMTEFNETFHRGRDGRYTMDSAVTNSPHQFAALMGHMFGDDPTAMNDFLGAHGAGGNRQILMKPVRDLISGYFAMGPDSQGRQRRGYDLVDDLARQSLSEGDVRSMENIRNSEERARINDEENHAFRQSTDQDDPAVRLAGRLNSMTAANPMLAPALTGGLGLLLSRAPSIFGGLMTTAGGGGAAGAGAGGAAVLLAGAGGLIAGELTRRLFDAGGSLLYGNRYSNTNSGQFSLMNGLDPTNSGARHKFWGEAGAMWDYWTGNQAANATTTPAMSAELQQAIERLPEATRQALSEGSITVNISPFDMVAAANVGTGKQY